MTTLTKSGGYLVTLVFPIDGSRVGGPPHSVHMGLYEDVLLGEGKRGASESDEWVKVLDKVPERSLEAHEGKERIVYKWSCTISWGRAEFEDADPQSKSFQ